MEIKEMVKEQDRWHRKYNDALIEIAKLTAEITRLESAIRTLIGERDMAIRDINHLFKRDNFCALCKWEGRCRYPEAEGDICTWRGITPR